MKTCSKCKQDKPLWEFYNDASKADGLRHSCKVCEKGYQSAWHAANRSANPEKVKAKAAAWYAANRKKVSAHNTAHQTANRGKANAKAAGWRKANRDKVAACDAKRRAAKLKATPAWANQFFIEEIYDLAQRRTKALGVEHHVDHIVPLKSKIVCGLHCEANIRIIPATNNLVKGNRFWPDMP